jgi:hypothetical protein
MACGRSPSGQQFILVNPLVMASPLAIVRCLEHARAPLGALDQIQAAGDRAPLTWISAVEPYFGDDLIVPIS